MLVSCRYVAAPCISQARVVSPCMCHLSVYFPQVRHAQQAGASAAIVYDDVYEALIIMSKPRDHPDPGIPAVFVSEKAGIIMKKLITPGQTRVHIVAVRSGGHGTGMELAVNA